MKEAKARTAIAKAKMMNTATVFLTLFSSNQTNTHMRLVFIHKLIYLLLDLNRTGKARAYLSALGAKKKSCTSQGQLSLTLPEVVIMFFLGAEASNALFFQLFPDFPSAFSVDFASSFQIANYFFGLFFSVASPNEVNDIWHIAIEAPRGHGFLSIL
ncbi:MAG: hypothetical protein ABSB89_04470 [Candidatus Bathyarchaeia archaeon]